MLPRQRLLVQLVEGLLPGEKPKYAPGVVGERRQFRLRAHDRVAGGARLVDQVATVGAQPLAVHATGPVGQEERLSAAQHDVGLCGEQLRGDLVLVLALIDAGEKCTVPGSVMLEELTSPIALPARCASCMTVPSVPAAERVIGWPAIMP